ncbi:hypothetical protein K488DRAFT_75390, partial [Vararia minispora EC-137]
MDAVDGVAGEKRKLNGFNHDRPRKRPRVRPPPLPPPQTAMDPLAAWWATAGADAILANALPPWPMETYTPEARPSANGALPIPTTAPDGTALGALGGTTLGAPHDGVTAAGKPKAAGKRKKKKVRTMAARPGSLLARMNANVATQRRVRAMHVGFQGASRMALDVLAGIMGEYLSNVGWTMRFYLDKYSGAMTAEEIILHTLLEGGIAAPADLERHIHDDVLRHGTRLAELEKKVLN